MAIPAMTAQAQSVMSHSQERDSLIRTVNVHHVAQETPVHRDSVEALIRTFYLDQFRQFHDPQAPTFMLMSKNASIALGVGGTAAVRGWFDWNGSQNSPSFYPYNISIPKNPTQQKMLGATCDKSSLFLSLLGRNGNTRYMVYLQGEINGGHMTLKRAYVNLADFTVGYASTTFADPDALAPTVDAQGPNGKASKTQVLARYFHTYQSGVSVGAGVEIPSSAQDIVDGETAACRDYVPDLVGLVQYGWGDSHVRVSGLMRTMTYRNLLTQTNHNVVGWGAQLSGRINIVPPFTAYFSGVLGRGVGSYQGDLSAGQYDLVGTSECEGKMIAPWSLGVTAGLKYQFSPKVFATVALGEQRYFQKHRLTDDQYKYGLYGAVNVFWRITPRFLAGVEYISGKRMNFNGCHAGANRLDALLSYSF